MLVAVKRDIELEATIVEKYAAVAPVLDERSRRRWAAAESVAIGYGGDALVSSATGLARETIRKGASGNCSGRCAHEPHSTPGRWTSSHPAGSTRHQGCARSAGRPAHARWRVSSTTVGRLLHRLGYRLQSPRKRQEGATHPDRNAQFEHINQTADKHLRAGEPVKRRSTCIGPRRRWSRTTRRSTPTSA